MSYSLLNNGISLDHAAVPGHKGRGKDSANYARNVASRLVEMSVEFHVEPFLDAYVFTVKGEAEGQLADAITCWQFFGPVEKGNAEAGAYWCNLMIGHDGQHNGQITAPFGQEQRP